MNNKQMNYNDDDIIRIKSGNTSVNMQLVHHTYISSLWKNHVSPKSQ